MMDANLLAESGILLVDKPEGWTSHDVVNCVRRRFRIRKVGHCGTLDPNATGLLVLVLGRATRLSSRLSGQDKVYHGVMRLGIETHTQDREGDVTAENDPGDVRPEDIERVRRQFVGDLMQVPPMVSAVKVDGKRLYKIARQGKVVEREPRPVVVHELKILEVAMPDVEFEVHCSKGTYVRTLCADMGRELGCGAHLYSLRRLRSGRFEVTGAVTMDAVKSWEREQLFDAMIPLQDVLGYL